MSTETKPIKNLYIDVDGVLLGRKSEADLVGMSTVPEVLVARQLGMKVLVLSVVSDECDPDHLEPINVPKILAIAKNAHEPLAKILVKVIGRV